MDKQTNNNLLDKLEKVSSGAHGSGLDPEKLSGLSMDANCISSFLDVSHIQAILFSVIAEQSIQDKASLRLVSMKLKCTVLKLLTYMDELKALEEKGYMKKTSSRNGRGNIYADTGFTVPQRVIEALSKGDRKMLERKTKFDLPGFLKAIADLVTERELELINRDSLVKESEYLISKNQHLSFVKLIDNRLKEMSSKIIIFALAYAKLNDVHAVISQNVVTAVFNDLGKQIEFTGRLKTGSDELITTGYLDFFDTGIESDNTVSLTKKMIMILKVSFPELATKKKKPEGIIDHHSIKIQKLFFRGKAGEDISKLEKVMQPGRFRKYIKELQNNKLNPGITAIFHGAPGTGKTELVYQLARKTGRDIMMVDLSKTKSKWFGESEKVIKKIFDDYREYTLSSHLEPILFINEGDGLFAHRLSLKNGGTSSDFAVNSIQNILLQELEDFEGIFITTTNLAGNLDRAFERRLTFKIEFQLPDLLTRKKIWKNKIPELKPLQAAELAEKHPVSGGDIDIAVRKLLLQKVIDKNTDTYTAIKNCFINDNKLKNNKKIGFMPAP